MTLGIDGSETNVDWGWFTTATSHRPTFSQAREQRRICLVSRSMTWDESSEMAPSERVCDICQVITDVTPWV